ncbi:MerR family transcriptional regulator [Vibrio nitrifigilis]|uniref:MerR family transcriptional regulator n=1 Tax=Vibrio nitrifigilis TaxID=2789781 RepID=A0ABS0GMK2_9VIBR|nr:MerR family transcriptional regulator [Vibrio nitrifigilis]MBF9003484.1 MerR family transcriptional regulator [Vibrio nitrifigilis]
MGCDSFKDSVKLYAIREVAELTGVKPVTLRAWQRRYNLVQPQRTDKGHRLYTEQDIELIRDIQSWLAKGVAIGKVSQLLFGPSESQYDENVTATALDENQRLLDYLAQFKRAKAQQLIATVFKEYPLALVEQQFVLPVYHALEQVKGPLKTLQKGLFQSLMVSRLASILESENKSNSKGQSLCISFDPNGSVLAWLWAVALSEQGWSVTYLEGVEDISGLEEHSGIKNYQHMALFSNHSLPESQYAAVRRLAETFNGTTQFSEVLQTLMSDH